MGVGLASLRPTPTFIVPVLPSRGDVLSLPQADRRFGFHREPDARHFAPRPPGHSAHQVDFVTQPRRSSGLVMAETTETPSLPSTPSLQATGMPCLLVHEHAQCAGTTLAGESAEFAGSRSRLDRRLLTPTLVRSADSEGPSSKHDCGHQTSMPVATSSLSQPLGRHLNRRDAMTR